MIIASFLVILGLFQHKHLRLIGGEFFLFVFICRNPSFSSYNLIETKVSTTTFMLYKPLCAFSHIPGVCGGTFSSPTGGFALPFAAAASCCAISLWVRSLRRLKHSRDIAVQLCGCPPGSAHKEQGLTQLLLPASVVTVPLCSQQELHCLSATQLLKCHRAFPLWQLVCTERNMKQIQWITLKRLQQNLLSKQETQAVRPIRSEITEQLKWTNISGNGSRVLRQYKHYNSW